MYQKFSKTNATVERCSAMESRYHSKNGASPKGQMSRRNFKRLLQLCICTYFLISCATPTKTYTLSVDGGSRADGIIYMSMVYEGGNAAIEWEDAKRKAITRCKNWGYNGAEIMDLPMMGCRGCKVIFKYQCTD
ncbi:MAG: YecR-like lipofamily protein [Bacteroidales bacterium]|nr:YecR-like lipofamily protein [Bacteroidales bacterium]